MVSCHRKVGGLATRESRKPSIPVRSPHVASCHADPFPPNPAAAVQTRNREGALRLFKLDNGFYPSTEQGLRALVEKPTPG